MRHEKRFDICRIEKLIFLYNYYGDLNFKHVVYRGRIDVEFKLDQLVVNLHVLNIYETI